MIKVILKNPIIMIENALNFCLKLIIWRNIIAAASKVLVWKKVILVLKWFRKGSYDSQCSSLNILNLLLHGPFLPLFAKICDDY